MKNDEYSPKDVIHVRGLDKIRVRANGLDREGNETCKAWVEGANILAGVSEGGIGPGVNVGFVSRVSAMLLCTCESANGVLVT
jgi:hypothetical protein